MTELYRLYTATVTEQTGFTSITPAISSISATRRNGSPTYLSVVVPGAEDVIDFLDTEAILKLKVTETIYYADGTSTAAVDFAEVTVESVDPDIGPRSSSMTISGHQTITYSSPATVAVSGITEKSRSAGFWKLQGQINSALNPGDTVTYDGTSFTCDLLQYSINAKSGTMTISEQET